MTIRFQAAGRNRSEVEADAKAIALDFLEGAWPPEHIHIEVSPLVHEMGSSPPVMWQADVEVTA